VQFGSNTADNVQYTYTATGRKVRKQVSRSKSEIAYTDYSGIFLYQDKELISIFTPAGRMVKNRTNELEYEYNLTDHLGNVRAVFAVDGDGKAELKQTTDYYPFGMVMNQTDTYCRSCPPNKFLYNGKEIQNDVIAGQKLDWYDYGARMYDAAVGRWHVVDPLAEKYAPISPYAYVANNPIIFIDPDGREIFLYGCQEAQDSYIKMLHTSTGNNYAIVDNKLILVGADANFKGTKSETLIKTIQSGIDSKDVFSISLVGANGDDTGVFIDSFTEAKIDLSDLGKLGNASTALQGAAIGHFLNEIQAVSGYSTATPKEREGMFNSAHNQSLGVEGLIFGELVGDPTISTRIDYPLGPASGGFQKVIFEYNSTNRFELQQGAKSISTTSNELNGVKVPFPVTTTTTVLNGALKSVKKIR